MGYQYSTKVGLQASPKRPAGQVAVYDHIILRLEDIVPSIITKYGTANTQALTYSLEYPEQLMSLPHISVTFVSEISKDIGLGMVAGGSAAGELSGFTKAMTLFLDIWARNSQERDLIADAILYCIHTSRPHFASKGIRDLRHLESATRNFEQADTTVYPRVSMQTTRVWRKVLSLQVEYDLVFVPPSEEELAIIEQIDLTVSYDDVSVSYQIGQVTDLILDSKYIMKEHLERLIW